MNTYYHVSFEKVDKFMPRIPSIRAHNEDASIPRICVCKRVEDCLLAMPDGGYALKGMQILAKHYNCTPTFYIYSVAESLVRECLICPDVLYSDFGVVDALDTNEYWITEAVPFYEEKVELCQCDYTDVLKSRWGIDGILFKNLEYHVLDRICSNTTVESVIRKKKELDYYDLRQLYKLVAQEMCM